MACLAVYIKHCRVQLKERSLIGGRYRKHGGEGIQFEFIFYSFNLHTSTKGNKMKCFWEGKTVQFMQNCQNRNDLAFE